MPDPVESHEIRPQAGRFRWVRRVGSAAWQGALFGAAFLGTARLLDRWMPPLEVPVIDEKLAYFADHRDGFDTLFLGSSHTYSQLFPVIFDEVTKRAGMPTKTFNFGIDGLFPPEDGYVAEKLFALRPKNLRRVFIEISFFRNGWVGMEPDSVRALHWHDDKRVALAWHDAFSKYHPPKPASKPKPFRWKDRRKHWENWRKTFRRWWTDASHGNYGTSLEARLTNMLTHLRIYARRTMNAGRGTDFLARLGRGTQRVFDWNVLGKDGTGVRVPPSREKIPEPPLDLFDRRLAEVSAKPVPLSPMHPALAENLRGIVALVRGVGAEPILFIAPDVTPCRSYLPDEPNLPLFDFTEVAKWPHLFRREGRLDSSHLDLNAARVFTNDFAQMFIDYERGKARP